MGCATLLGPRCRSSSRTRPLREPEGRSPRRYARGPASDTGMLLVVLDQFEEYFQYHPDEGNEERLTGFAAELARIVNDPSLPVTSFSRSARTPGRSSTSSRGISPRYSPTTSASTTSTSTAAREAIEGPIEAWNRSLPEGEQPFEIEPALVDAVSPPPRRRPDAHRLGESPDAEASGDRVEAPFLQLVLDRLWRRPSRPESTRSLSPASRRSAVRPGSSRATSLMRSAGSPAQREIPRRSASDGNGA